MSSVLYPRQSGSVEASCWLYNLVDGYGGIVLKVKSTLFCDASPFQKVEVVDTYGFGRVLILGGTVVFTEKDEHVYNEMITHPAMFSHKNPKNVCIIGGGDGGCLREALKHGSAEKVTVVEIDSMVTDAVKRFFPSMSPGFEDSRTEIFFNDGYEWLKKSKKKFDVIIVDSYDPSGPVQSLETGDFFEVVKKSLNKDGFAVFQTDSPELNREKIRRTMRDVSTLFKDCRPYFASIPSFPLGICSFILCGMERVDISYPEAEKVQSVVDSCQYYSEDIHRGAFLLPRAVGDVFK